MTAREWWYQYPHLYVSYYWNEVVIFRKNYMIWCSCLPTLFIQHDKQVDDDDVYLRFGGRALCAMFHLHYEEIKNCSETRWNILSQEITILQAIKMKNKSKLPQYLMYRDDGYMYFPDVPLIPFLRSIDELVKSVVNVETIQDNDEIIKVTTILMDWYLFNCIIIYRLYMRRWKSRSPSKNLFFRF